MFIFYVCEYNRILKSNAVRLKVPLTDAKITKSTSWGGESERP